MRRLLSSEGLDGFLKLGEAVQAGGRDDVLESCLAQNGAIEAHDVDCSAVGVDLRDETGQAPNHGGFGVGSKGTGAGLS